MPYFVTDVVLMAFIPRSQPQIISYFFNEALNFGAVVEVPYGKRLVKAIVVGSESLAQRKLSLRKVSDFQLKTIATVLYSSPRIARWQFNLAKVMSSAYYAPLGTCLKTILPKFWDKKKTSYEAQDTPPIERTKPPKTSFIATSDLFNHHEDYKDTIEKVLAEAGQALLLIPDATYKGYFLEKYADLDPLFYDSSLLASQYNQAWSDTASGKAKLIIASRSGLFLPFHNLRLLIVDDETHHAYRSDMTPRYDTGVIAKHVAETHQAELIINALVPSVETYKTFQDLDAGAKLPQSTASNMEFIDMVQELKDANFSLFSRTLKEAIQETVSNKTKLILFCSRRGHTTAIVCKVCGTSVTCPRCSTPLILHKSPREVLLCHHCSFQSGKVQPCSKCRSNQLKRLGAGIEKVEEELVRFCSYQNISAPPILKLDSDSTTNEASEQAIMAQFQETASAILLATPKLFSYKYLIRTPIIGIINADLLTTMPNFEANSLFLQTTSLLSGMTDELLVQTHTIDNPQYRLIAEGNHASLFEQELENRQLLGYPPYSDIVKLVYRHKEQSKTRNEAQILFKKLELAIGQLAMHTRILPPAPAFIYKENNLFVWNLVLKCFDQDIQKRNRLLSYVPSQWRVEINPESLL